MIRFKFLLPALLSCIAAAAAPALPGPIVRTQPGGRQITVLLQGDENEHQTTTTDGWLLLEDGHGTLRYAVYRKGELKAGCLEARDTAERPRCHNRWLTRHGIKR
ncbi:MAG: hypothetical protein J6Z12_01245 [Paludibacteraceae bacterium]|nr:hypothetical protein [Paludibacteraceae bacterium]